MPYEIRLIGRINLNAKDRREDRGTRSFSWLAYCMLVSPSACLLCPDNSSPRLNGYFCESCLKGSEPKNPGVENYGCSPCKVDTYKANDGMDLCVPCEQGKYTNNTIGSAMCFTIE